MTQQQRQTFFRVVASSAEPLRPVKVWKSKCLQLLDYGLGPVFRFCICLPDEDGKMVPQKVASAELIGVMPSL